MTYEVYNAPIGPLLIKEDDGHIVEVSFMEADTRPGFRDDTPLLHSSGTSAIIANCIRELDAYFSGILREFTVPIKLNGTDFQKRTWAALMTIPYGNTISYKQLAKRIGQPNAARAVGSANNRNPISIIVPCHRVVGANGALVGYGGGLGNKEFLLELEKAQTCI